MLVKCIKVLSENDEQSSTLNNLQIGKKYPVLGITSASNNENIYYFIQTGTSGQINSQWIDSRLFEVVNPKVYSKWVVDISFENNIETITTMPKSWKENSSWFMKELEKGTARAKNLFIDEYKNIVAEENFQFN